MTSDVRELITLPEVREWLQGDVYHDTSNRFVEWILSPRYEPKWLKKEDARRVTLDLETYYLTDDLKDGMFFETGSTHYISKQRVGACVSIDTNGPRYWEESQMSALLHYLVEFDEIVMFNGLRFDFVVLSGYTGDYGLIQELYNRAFDMMFYMQMHDGDVQWRSMNYYARKHLGRGKLRISGRSRGVPELLRKGSPEEVRWVWHYCHTDAVLTDSLYRTCVSFEYKQKYLEWVLGSVGRVVNGAIPDDAKEWVDEKLIRRQNHRRVVERVDDLRLRIERGDVIRGETFETFVCFSCDHSFDGVVSSHGGHEKACLWNYYLLCPKCGYATYLAKCVSDARYSIPTCPCYRKSRLSIARDIVRSIAPFPRGKRVVL